MMNVLKKLLVVGFLAVSTQSVISANNECDLKKIARFVQEVKRNSNAVEKEKVVEWLYSLLKREGIAKSLNYGLWSSECLIAESVIDLPISLNSKLECLLEEMKRAKVAQWYYLGKLAIGAVLMSPVLYEASGMLYKASRPVNYNWN